MTVAGAVVRSRGWHRDVFTPRNAVILTLFDMLIFVTFGVAYLSPLTPAAVWHDAGGAVTAATVLPFAALVGVGGLIARRRPDNLVGWVLLLSATAFGIGALCSLLGTLLLTRGIVAGRWVQLGAVLWTGTGSPAFFGFGVTLLLFPDGRLSSRRWRWLLYGGLAMVALTLFAALVNSDKSGLGITYVAVHGVDQSSPFAIASLAAFTSAVINDTGILQLAFEALAVASVFLRLRGADAERRQQIKWFAAGSLVIVVGFALTGPLGNPVYLSAPGFALYVILSLVAVLALPVAVAVAVLRYRLYDIDVIINRALVYGALAIFITAVYVGIAVGVGVLVGSGGKPDLGLSILATAIVAVGFQPLRQRLQRIANRLIYGRRATPYQVLSQFSSQVAGSYAADEVLPRMARVLEEGTGAERSTVWLRSGDTLHAVATWPVAEGKVPVAEMRVLDGALPDAPGATRTVEVRHQDELLGALSVEKRRGESLTPVEEKLLGDLAHQAGLVLKNVGLTADLQRRLEELRASRQRLVSAQDQERRKLERNLHDGAQQYLVAIKVKLGLAEMLTGKDTEKATQTIRQLKSDADEALETVRDLARGIYPPLLAEKGLPTALESQARKATLPVTVDADGVRRYSQEVEATVYFCVLEALQNVQKYAKASHVVVRLREQGAMLRFEVEDDGQGFDVSRVRRGAGLTNMRDRVDAADGDLTLVASVGAGTRVIGLIPAREPIRADGLSRTAHGAAHGETAGPTQLEPARKPGTL